MDPQMRRGLGPRVAFLVTSMHGGGAEAVGRAWMAGLVERGWVVLAITVGADGRAQHAPDGVAVAHAGGGSHGSRVARTAARLSEFAAETVVALQTYPNLVALAAARRLPRGHRPPVVISEHNMVSLGIPGSTLRHRSKVRAARLSYRRAAHALASSHPVAAELVSWFAVPGDNCTVVPNPVLPAVAGFGRQTQRVGPDAPLDVVVPGRVVRQKRPALAVATVAELRRRGVDARLVSFGGGPLVGELAAAAESASVPFDDRGWVEDWTAAAGPNAVVLLPSVREGFGNVLVEAAAAGIPSVAPSAALGVADAILPGITGELAASSTPDALADAVLASRARVIPDVSPWLARFTHSHSTAVLAGVLDGVRGRAT